MELRPEQLAGALRRELPDILWIHGDDPLLMQDCISAVRNAFRSATNGERQRFSLEPSFAWPSFGQACAESSLFAPRTLIELHMQEPKPGKQGSEWLRRVADRPPGGNPLLIVTGKLPREVRNSAWGKALLKTGWLVSVRPLRREDLPGWIHRELKQEGLQADSEAVQMLADCTEGNLLAARQEIHKLALLHPGGQLTAPQLRELLADQSRFSVFELVDTALAGHASRALHCLQAIRETGAECIQVLWALSREVRTLHNIASAVAQGRALGAAMQDEQIWQSRTQLVSQAAKRLPLQQLDHMLLQCARTDQAIKGRNQENPWQLLENITLALSGRPLQTESQLHL